MLLVVLMVVTALIVMMADADHGTSSHPGRCCCPEPFQCAVKD